MVEKQAQNILLESTANWLIDTMRHLTLLSSEPISIQYDQTLNRLTDLSSEIQVKLSQIQGINPMINNTPSFEQNRSKLINDLENTKENIDKLINNREQVQVNVQQLDNIVSLINKNIKILRTNLENYRFANNDLDELLVNH